MDNNKIEKEYRGFNLKAMFLHNQYQGGIFVGAERIYYVKNCSDLNNTIEKLVSYIDNSPDLYNEYFGLVKKYYKGFHVVFLNDNGEFLSLASNKNGTLFISTNNLNEEDAFEKAKDAIDKNRVFIDFIDSTQLTYKGLKLEIFYFGDDLHGEIKSGKKILFSCKEEKDFNKLYLQLQNWIETNEEEAKRAIGEIHKIHLEKNGIDCPDAINISLKKKSNRFRATHCWACKHPIDNTTLYECNFCSWIICFCGACGCGYNR